MFVCLFFLAFVQINDPKEKKENANNNNNILITMNWETNNDMDLWLKLPNGKHVGYSSRDHAPAHLDVDVVAWRRYRRDNYSPSMKVESDYGEFGEFTQEHEQQEGEYIIKNNEEIISIRDVMPGEYVVNVHYYSARGYQKTPINVGVLVQDVKNERIIYYDEKKITSSDIETHFVKFTIVEYGNEHYLIEKIYDDRPTYFLGKN